MSVGTASAAPRVPSAKAACVPADHGVGVREGVLQPRDGLVTGHLGEGLNGTFPHCGHR
ncbi:hypothetical protein GCM10027162_46520 [Streptomyces incanus]